MASSALPGLTLPGMVTGTSSVTAASIKAASTPNQKKAAETAKQFEGVFLSSMLSQMFAGLQGDGPMGTAGAGGDAWRSMLVEQYGNQFAASGGLGLSDAIYKQLLSLQEVS